MSEQLKEQFLSFCGKHVRITLNDDRRVYGTLSCFDAKKNFVIQDAVEEIKQQYVTPINENMQIYIRKENWFMRNNPQLEESVKDNEELLSQLNKKWMENKFVIGQVIIPGKFVKKFEMVEGYPKELPIKQEQQQQQVDQINTKTEEDNKEQNQQEN